MTVSQSHIIDSAGKVIYIDSRHIFMCLLSRYRQLRPSQTQTCIKAFCTSLNTNLNHPSPIIYNIHLFFLFKYKFYYGSIISQFMFTLFALFFIKNPVFYFFYICIFFIDNFLYEWYFLSINYSFLDK